MKKMVSAILLFSLLFALFGCSKEEEIINPYRPLSYKSEFFEDGELTGRDLSIYQYDEHGYLSKTMQYRDDFLTLTNTYENDAYGNVLKVTSTSEDTTSILEHQLTLDEEGRILYQKAYTDGALYSTMSCTYDSDGNVTGERFCIIKDGVEEVLRNREMTYRKGKLSRTVDRDPDGSYIIYDYKDGKPVKTSYYSPAEELTRYWEYDYNKAGQLIREASYICETNGDSRTSVLSSYDLYTYDETGLIVTRTNHSPSDDRPYDTKTVITYDEYGNELLQERYRDDALYWRITQKFELIP